MQGRRGLILKALQAAKNEHSNDFLIVEAIAAPSGASLVTLRSAVSKVLNDFTALRTRVVLDAKGVATTETFGVDKVDLNLCVTSNPMPSDLSPLTGRLFSVALLDGVPSPNADEGGASSVRCIVLFMHAFAGDVASARAFLHAIATGKGGSALADASAEADADTDAARKYWEAEVDPTAPVVQINADFSRPLQRQKMARVVRAELSSKLQMGVKKLAADLGVSVRAVYTSAFALLVYRRTLEEDLIISTQLDKRDSKSASGSFTFGQLTEQVYLRVPVEDTKGMDVLIKAVNGKLKRAQENLGLGFEEIMDKFLPLDESKGGEQEAKTQGMEALARIPEDQRFSPAEFIMDKSPYKNLLEYVPTSMEMRLRVTEVGDSCIACVEFQPQLFHIETARDTLAQFMQVLEQGTSPKSLFHVNLVTPRARPLIPDPNVALDPSWPGDIASCFVKIAAKHPQNTVIVYQGQKVSYAQLERLVDTVCCCLQRAGITKGDVIGLYGHRSPAVVWAIMGILRAGAAYTMMDPKYPTGRIELCLGIAGIKGFLHLEAAGRLDPKLETSLKEFQPTLLFVAPLPAAADTKEIEKAFGQSGAPSPPSGPPEISRHDVAVVTFTSGSTGIPKGVQGRHASLSHFYDWMSSRFTIGADDRFSMCSGIAHDPLQRDIFTPLYFGAEIHIPTDEDIAEPGRLAKWTKKVGVSISCFTPAMGQLLVSGDQSTAPTLEVFRLAFFVGAMLVKRDVQMLRRLAPNVRVINMYGSTESQRAVGYLEIVSTNEEKKGLPAKVPSSKQHDTCVVGIDGCKEVIPVGIGMDDAQMLILNKAGCIAGIGEMSEIYMRSPHIALGYIGKPEVTKARFIPNPFASKMLDSKEDRYAKLGDRMYKTGDLGRYRYDGFVECCGRADDQIKIRGFRVELGEINATLSQCPSVQDNIVIAIDDTIGSKMLVGYLVETPRPGLPPPKPIARGAKPIIRKDAEASKLAAAAKKFLKKRLPYYMVPTNIIVLESLPLTANGKINTRALPAPERVTAGAVPGNDQDVTKHEKYKGIELTHVQKALIRSWSRVLKIEAPGLEENFFDLGGHSLAATQLTLEMRNMLPDREVPMGLLFQHPCIKELAQALEKKSEDTKERSEFDLENEIKTIVSSKSFQMLGKNSNNAGINSTPLAEARGVFLTGSTGFLGAFLARELVRRTSSSTIIYCGARGRGQDAVKQRVFENLENHKIHLSENEKKRVVPVVCDLSKPRFGMTEKEFGKLAKSIDAIVHNGAYVHWMLPYQRLKPTNVEGTITIMQLATLGNKIVPVHYVSTTSVFDDEYHAKQSVVYENDTLTNWKGLSGGYPQSKWAAERVLMAAATTCGIPVGIYRPGYVVGDCEHGLWNTDDFQVRLIKGCVLLGAYPFPEKTDSDGRLLGLDASPVDYVAEAIVELASKCNFTATPLKAFHIVNPNPIPYALMYEKISSFGYNLKKTPYSEWREKLLQSVQSSSDANPLAAVVANFSKSWANNLPNPKYDMAEAEKGFKGSKSNIMMWMDKENKTIVPRVIECPDIEKLVQVYLSYLIGCGFLEPPANSPVDWKMMGAGFKKLARSNRT